MKTLMGVFTTVCVVAGSGCGGDEDPAGEPVNFETLVISPVGEAVHDVDGPLVIHAYRQSPEGPLELVFFAHSQDPQAKITRFDWDLGDDTSSDLPLLGKVYDQPGTYEVRLTAMVDDGSGVTEQTAKLTLNVAKLAWKVTQYQLDVGENWKRHNSAPLCDNVELPCGPATVTLEDVPNGVFDLRLYLRHKKATKDGEPEPRFLVDGELKDFVPKKQQDEPWSYETLKTVTITDNQLRFIIEDVADAGVAFSHVALRRIDENTSDKIRIGMDTGREEMPQPVDFTIDSAKSIKSAFWDFGDGESSDQLQPQHTYALMGRYHVTLAYETIDGVRGVATETVTIGPSKVNLPGLKDIKHFGFWSSGLKSADAVDFNQRRIARFKDMHVTHFWPNGTPGRDPSIGTGVDFSARELWFRNDEKGQPKDKWIFDPEQAIDAMRETDKDNDGISDLNGQDGVDWVYMGHEIGEYTNHEQRVKMRDEIIKFFPGTPVLPYYGNIHLSFLPKREQVDNQIGPGEGDIVCVSTQDPFIMDDEDTRKFDPRVAVNALLNQKRYAVQKVPELPYWALKHLPGEKLGSDPKDEEKAVKEMWSAEELLDYARVLLTVGDIEAMIFRAYDRWTYDLSFGDNDEDPSQPEFGFIEQRLAMKTIGSWIHQARNGRQILMIRSPEIGMELGKTVTIDYAIVNVVGQKGVPVFSLDGASGQVDSDGDGTMTFANVSPGQHSLRAHIEQNGDKVEGSDVEVTFTTND